MNAAELAEALEELIAAIDRRLPGLEGAREKAIAHDASVLRRHAAARLADLVAARAPDPTKGH
jgi:hypothetical protein